MLARLFTDHPRTVHESYLGHQATAFRVGGRMFVAALKCFVHGLVPAFFQTAGSDAILKLHAEVATRRPVQPKP